MRDEIRKYLSQSLLIDFGGNVDDETDLFEAGLMDSYAFVELVSFLERQYGMEVSEDELYSSELTSLAGIERFVSGKRRGMAA
jgi:acyl carrier protein